jgi:transposase
MKQLGQELRSIAPRYVKLIKRQKNDAVDAEAIVEAALRPTMRYVEPKTAEQQSRAIVFRTRKQFVNQRTGSSQDASKRHSGACWSSGRWPWSAP